MYCLYDLLNTVIKQTSFILSDVSTVMSFPFMDKEGSSTDLPRVPWEPCVILHLCLCLQVFISLIARDEISQPSAALTNVMI